MEYLLYGQAHIDINSAINTGAMSSYFGKVALSLAVVAHLSSVLEIGAVSVHNSQLVVHNVKILAGTGNSNAGKNTPNGGRDSFSFTFTCDMYKCPFGSVCDHSTSQPKCRQIVDDPDVKR